MDSPLTNTGPTLNVDNVPLVSKGFEVRTSSWKTYTNPELLQPTIIAISATYIVYAIAALYKLTPFLPAESQFSYYVASLGLISGLLFYARFASSSSSYVSFMELAFIASSSILIAVYIMYWFITPNFNKVMVEQNQNLDLADNYGLSRSDENYASPSKPESFNITSCIDSRKCSHPIHLVLQSAFMICVVITLIFSIIRRG